MLEKILAAADEVNVSTPPTIPTTGTAGFPQDKATGVKGTPVKSWQYYMLHQSLVNVITGLGGTFGPNVTALWAALAPRLSGILSHATDTGSATTDHRRAVVAAYGRATGQDSAAVACNAAAWASGQQSLVAAAYGGEASGTRSAVHNAYNCYAGAEGTEVAGAHTECVDAYTFAEGGSAAPISKSGANQNIKVKTNRMTGEVHQAGDLKVGGDPNTGTGYTLDVDAGTGNLTTDGMVAATGGIETQAGLASAAYGTPWTATVNAVGGTVVVPFSVTHKLVYAYATLETVRVTCDKVASNSRVHVAVDYRTGDGGFPVAIVSQGTGTFDVLLQTLSPGVDIESDVYLHFDVINPAH